MNKAKKSGPAIFMDFVILIMAGISTISFVVYYTNIYKVNWTLWCGITAFTIIYHLWMRIIMGKVTTRFKSKMSYASFWFKEKRFEKKLYKLLRVKKWKSKALTYEPELFSLKGHSLEEIILTTTKAETDHWINEAISISTLLFALVWGNLWFFIIIAIVAMLFDAQFIIIQRYNRPRVLKLIEKQKRNNSK